MTLLRMQQDGDDVLIWIKAVPGASRDHVAGLVGERLKVRTSAAAEAGKANAAICTTLARAIGARPRQVSIESGQTNPEKIIRVQSMTVREIRSRL